MRRCLLVGLVIAAATGLGACSSSTPSGVRNATTTSAASRGTSSTTTAPPTTAPPTSVPQTTTANCPNCSAQSNLTNALTEAKALYQVDQAYGSRPGDPYLPGNFSGQAPEFTWTLGSCKGQTASCVSEEVVDVATAGDSQGVVLAVWSAPTALCWYAVDLEASPTAISLKFDRTPFDSGSNHNTGLSAGVYYSMSPEDVASCSASTAVSAQHQAHWGTNYADAGIVS
jgi:hypothetical protein